MIVEHAQKQSYMFVGAVSVAMEVDEEVRAGRVNKEATVREAGASYSGTRRKARGGLFGDSGRAS